MMKKHDNKTENTAQPRLLTENMKMADLLESDYRLLSIISRLDIPFGFGESTVGEMCRRHGLSAELFLLICRIYSSDGTCVPAADMLAVSDLAGIMNYLHSSHIYYSESVIPRLGSKIGEMMDACDAIHRKILNSFYSDYRREVANPFDYEEQTVFPSRRALMEGRSIEQHGYSIEKFEANHSDIDAKLNDLKSIIIKYLPDSCPAGVRYDVLLEIFRFEEDLSRHTDIENNVLIPLVGKLEKSLQQQ